MPLMAPAIWPDLRELLFRHALRTVAQQRVRDFVAHHDRHRVVVLRDRDQARVHRHLPARQAERVDLVGLQQVDVPIEGLLDVRRLQAVFGGERVFDLRDLRDQALRDRAHRVRIRIARRHGCSVVSSSFQACRPSAFSSSGVMLLSITTFSPVSGSVERLENQ